MGAAFKRLKNEICIGMYEDVCIRCAQELHPSMRASSVGKLIGKKIFKGRTLNGSDFCICEDCLKEIGKTL